MATILPRAVRPIVTLVTDANDDDGDGATGDGVTGDDNGDNDGDG